MAPAVSPVFNRAHLVLRTLCVAGLFLGGPESGCGSEGGRSSKKIIYYGWDSPDTRYVARHWREIEPMPFDGLGVQVALDPEKPVRGEGCTGNLLGWQVFGKRLRRPERLNQRAKELREPRWGRVRELFLPVAIATRDQDLGFNWFDDGRWSEIERNWEDLVALARNGGCRGIIVDPEHYDYECELFSYRQHREQRSERDFRDYAAQATRRGRSLGEAIRTGFPKMTIAFTYGYALADENGQAGRALPEARYALLPAFLDGLVRGACENAHFVDLYEAGHGFTTAQQWEGGLRKNREDGFKLTKEPDLVARFFEVGTSVRWDAAVARSRWAEISGGAGAGKVAGGVSSALRHAIEASSQYVWLYSEGVPRLFPGDARATPYLEGVRAAREFLQGSNTGR